MLRIGSLMVALGVSVGALGDRRGDSIDRRAHVRILAAQDTVVFDGTIRLRADGLVPGDTATLRVRAVDALGRLFTSSSAFIADEHGTIDPATQSPLRAAYSGVSPMGPVWVLSLDRSVAPAHRVPTSFSLIGFDELPTAVRGRFRDVDTASTGLAVVPTHFQLVVRGITVASTTVVRRVLPPGTRVTRVRERGIIGTLYEPPDGEPRAALLALTGSDGGMLGTWPLLAEHGYTVLVLAWYNVPGLTDRTVEIPIDGADSALAYLASRPGVDPTRIGVVGWSRGGELALLLASYHPEIAAVISMAGGPVVWEGTSRDSARGALATPTGRSTWMRRGVPVPFAPRRWATSASLAGAFGGPGAAHTIGDLCRVFAATLDDSAAIDRGMIPLERARAAFMFVSARDDPSWPSTELSALAIARLRRAAYAYRVDERVYDVGGEAVAFPPEFGWGERARSGVSATFLLSGEDAWRAELRFLDETLLTRGSAAIASR